MGLLDLLPNANRAADIAATGGVGLWEWDIAAGKFWFSEYAKFLLRTGNNQPVLAEVQKQLYIEDQDVFARAFEGVAENAQPFEIMVRVQSKVDHFRWLRWRGQVRRLGEGLRLTGTIQDVHDERLIQLELEFTQDMLNEAQRIARLGSWQYDILSDRLFWSAETFNIFGRDISLGAPQGDSQARYFDNEDYKILRQKAQIAVQSGHPYQADLHAVRDDGHAIMVRIIGRPIFDRAGKASLVAGTIQDITDWTDLKQAHARAEENQRTQSQFLASVSHEIRTPMNAIFGMAQMLLMAALPPQQMEQTRVILSAARDLLAIIDDLLDLAKVEAGHMTLENIPFDLHETLREVTVLHAGKIYGKDLEFIVNLSPDVPQMIEGDPLRLKQVVGNLLSNAAKFTRQGQITLTITHALAVGTPMLRFTISDTGIGIPSHRLASVFQKYVQAETSTARQYGGSGLGLAICRELVELMGGEIHVTSSEQTGTQFWFDVPLHAASGGAAVTLDANILLLEPSKAAADNIIAQLQSLGAKVTGVTQAEELLKILSKHKTATHVLIADHKQYNANDLAIDVRKMASPGQLLGLVLLTLPITQNVMNDGFDAIMLKPALPHELYRAIVTAQKAAAENRKESIKP
jgi:signal transduction histidine kinase/CheY-like chemotaxis protein